MKQGKSVICLFFSDKPIYNHINEIVSSRALHWYCFRMGIFKNNQITLVPCFTFVPKTGFSFYCALFGYRQAWCRRFLIGDTNCHRKEIVRLGSPKSTWTSSLRKLRALCLHFARLWWRKVEHFRSFQIYSVIIILKIWSIYLNIWDNDMFSACRWIVLPVR